MVVDTLITVLYTPQRCYMVGATIYNSQGRFYLSAKMKVFGTKFVQTSCRTTVKTGHGLILIGGFPMKKALHLSVNVFSKKVLIGEGTAILHGHPNHAKV